MITGEADVLRDEGEAYAAKLREAGVDVTATRYEGIIHDFVMLNALREHPRGRRRHRAGHHVHPQSTRLDTSGSSNGAACPGRP